MKRITISAIFIALSSFIFAQTYMSVWKNGVKMDMQISAIDSITFGDTETSNGIGIFSVSPNDKVTFSKGNLQYHPKKNKWQFANNQYDYFGNANMNISSDYNGWIDLFGWGTGNNPTKSANTSYGYETFVDWGVNQIGDDAPNTWRTLTSAEWEYLLESRPNAKNLLRFGSIKVNGDSFGEHGVILLPDNWVAPEDVEVKEEYYQNDFTIEQWFKLQQAGAVFLPKAGSRWEQSYYSGDCCYWSATGSSDTKKAIYLDFSITLEEYTKEYEYRCQGNSVRLVRDL